MPQHSETCGRGRRQEWRHDKQIISNNYYYSTYSWFFKHLETTMTYHDGFSPLCRSRPLSDAGMGRHHRFPLFGAEDKSVIRCSLQWLATLAYYNLSTVRYPLIHAACCRARKSDPDAWWCRSFPFLLFFAFPNGKAIVPLCSLVSKRSPTTEGHTSWHGWQQKNSCQDWFSM